MGLDYRRLSIGALDRIRDAATLAQRLPLKRIGWHTLRHTFGTLLKSNGEDVATVQSLMRHANVSVTMDRYVQAVTPAKRKAQRTLIQQLTPNDSKSKAAKSASA